MKGVKFLMFSSLDFYTDFIVFGEDYDDDYDDDDEGDKEDDDDYDGGDDEEDDDDVHADPDLNLSNSLSQMIQRL